MKNNSRKIGKNGYCRSGKVEDKANGEIQLNDSDFVGRDVFPSTDFKDGVVPDDADVSNLFCIEKKNTKINYLYRDACNYKSANSEIIEGRISQNQINEIIACLEDGCYFIPCQIGFSEIRCGSDNIEDDHCWFELSSDDFEYVDEEPTLDMDIDELIEEFKDAADNWDENLWLENYTD